jgi:hypothetical protein
VGVVSFQFEFEEIFDFKLDFKDWGVLSTTGDTSVADERYMVTVSALKYQSGLPLLADAVLGFFYKYPFRGRVPAIISPLSLICPTGGTPEVSRVTPMLEPVFRAVNIPVGGAQEYVGCRGNQLSYLFGLLQSTAVCMMQLGTALHLNCSCVCMIAW